MRYSVPRMMIFVQYFLLGAVALERLPAADSPAGSAPVEGNLAGEKITLAASDNNTTSPGHLFIVGTGPGDPELITVKAANLLRKADAVFCFQWMKNELEPFVQADRVTIASPLLMGGHNLEKLPDGASAESQNRAAQAARELNKMKLQVALLVSQGKTVVFADNGDPTLFSPWIWATREFAEHQPVVIPGVSSFNAASAVLRLGVGGAGLVTITSGRELGVSDKAERINGTVVFFTHQKKLDDLLPSLQSRFPADTPIAIVCDVSYPAERVIRGTLGDIRKAIGDAKLPQLYLIYVGDGLKSAMCCPTPDRK